MQKSTYSPSSSSVKVRFAPSPTGSLHIGGVRTALFNYLFAKHYGGTYYVRIEDTDVQRSTEIFAKEIINTLNWLSLNPTNPTYSDVPYIYQSQRHPLYQKAIQHLIHQKLAYYCYTTENELQGIDPEARMTIIRKWRNQHTLLSNTSITPTVRFQSPMQGKTEIKDLIQGHVTIKNTQLDDFVLNRSDGSPTYMLAAVVDDYLMGITHIIRGDDHFNNAFRQYYLFQALISIHNKNQFDQDPFDQDQDITPLCSIPQFAHIPLIHNASGKKLSKRDGAMDALSFKNQGIMPDALLNYCLLLGFSYENQDYIPRQQAIEVFDLDKVGKSPARWSEKKLQAMGKLYIQKSTPQHIVCDLQHMPFISSSVQQALTSNNASNNASSDDLSQTLPQILQQSLVFFQHHAKNLYDINTQLTYILESPSYSFDAPLPFDETHWQQVIVPLSKMLKDIPLNQWNDAYLHEKMQKLTEDYQIPFKDIGMPLRFAITAQYHTPSITKIMEILGKTTSLIRLQNYLSIQK